MAIAKLLIAEEPATTCLFIGVGGVLLSGGWDH
jgi:hypothetical protein